MGFSRQEYWSGLPSPSPKSLYGKDPGERWSVALQDRGLLIVSSLKEVGRARGWSSVCAAGGAREERAGSEESLFVARMARRWRNSALMVSMILGKVRSWEWKGRWQNGRKSEEGGKGLKYLLQTMRKEPAGEGCVRINKYKSVVVSLHEAPHNPAIRNWILLPLSSNAFISILAYFLPSTFQPRGPALRSIPHLALGWTVSAAITLFDALAWTTTLNPDESCRSAAPVISLHSWLPNDIWCPQPNLASFLQQATFTASSSPSPSAYPNLTLTLSCSPDMLAFPCLGISTHVAHSV